MKAEENPLINPDFSAGILYNFEQFGIYYKNGKLYGISTEANGIGRITGLSKPIKNYKLLMKPFALKGKLKKSEVERLEQLIEDIATHKFPKADQMQQINLLPSSADTIKTQAILKFCTEYYEKYGCHECPMFVSELGCPDYLERDVMPQYISNGGKQYTHEYKQDHFKKLSFPIFVHTLRAYISWDKFLKLKQKIEQRQEFDDLMMGEFEGSGEMK